MAEYEFSLILVTAPADGELADRIAKGLVEGRLAACVTRQTGVVSHYFWEGKLETEAETLMFIKTRASLVSQVSQFVRTNHSSKTPEIIALPIISGEENYLIWLGSNTKFGDPLTKPKTPL